MVNSGSLFMQLYFAIFKSILLSALINLLTNMKKCRIIYRSEFETILTIIKTKGEIKMNIKSKTAFTVSAGMIAAIYVILTVITNSFGLANGVIQVRLSEALTILPVFTPAAVPGLFIGCIVSNLLTGCALPDIIFGSIATLIGALLTRKLKNHPFAATIPPVVSNAVIIPLVLRFAYRLDDAWWFMVATVGAGEIISCCVLGLIVYFALRRHAKYLFKI